MVENQPGVLIDEELKEGAESLQPKLLSVSACPKCGGSFTLREFLRNGEVSAGLLLCNCGAAYPIVDGIPRILPDAFEENGPFAEKYADELQQIIGRRNNSELQRFRQAHGRTQESFGREWLAFEAQRADEDLQTFQIKTGWSPADLAGKLVLDAGCGGGRYAYIAGQEGAEVVAIDLSRAVEKARQITAGMTNVHLVQGNLMAPPLRPETFDAIYSIGVLHHTPDTKAALMALMPLLKPGGSIAVWLYQWRSSFHHLANSSLRAVTTRLPHGLLQALCYAAVPLGSLKGWIAGHSSLSWLNSLLPVVSSHPDWRIRVCDTFDWYSPQYQWHHTASEVKEWYVEADLVDIEDLAARHQLGGVNIRGRKPAGRITDEELKDGT